MRLDLALGGILVLFGLFGLLSGVLAQLPKLLALAVALLATGPLGALLTPLALKRFGGSPALMGAAVSLVLFAVLSAAVALLARLAFGVLFPGVKKGAVDRGMGFLFGAAKAGAVLYVLLAACTAVAGTGSGLPAGLGAEYRSSRAVSFVRAHNLLEAYWRRANPLNSRLPGKGAAPASPGLASLLNDPRFKTALSSGGASGLLSSPELQQLMKDPQVQQLLNDPQLQQMLKDPNLAARLRQFQSGSAAPAPEPSGP